MSWSRLITAAAVLGLAGCGFTPLYGKHGSGTPAVAEQLANVAIPTIPDRIGQLVRNELLDLMTPRGMVANPRYSLSVRLTESTDTQLLRFDSTASRLRYTLRAQYQLASEGKILNSGAARSLVSYELPDAATNYYASVANAREAERQAATDVAQQIRTRVAVFLADHAGAGAATQP